MPAAVDADGLTGDVLIVGINKTTSATPSGCPKRPGGHVQL